MRVDRDATSHRVVVVVMVGAVSEGGQGSTYSLPARWGGQADPPGTSCQCDTPQMECVPRMDVLR